MIMRKLRLLALIACAVSFCAGSHALELKDLEGLWEGELTTDYGEGPKELPSLLHVFKLKDATIVDSLKAMVKPDQEYGGVFGRYFSLTGVTDIKVVDDSKIAFVVTAGMDAKKTAQVTASYTPENLQFTIPQMNNETEMVVKLRRIPANERAELTDKQVSGLYRGSMLPEHVAPEMRNVVADLNLDMKIAPAGANITIQGTVRLPLNPKDAPSSFSSKVVEAQRFGDLLYIFIEKSDPEKYTVGDMILGRLYPGRMRVYGIIWGKMAGGGTLTLVEPDEIKE